MSEDRIVCIYDDNATRELVRMEHNNANTLSMLCRTYNQACEHAEEGTLNGFTRWLESTELAERVERIIPDIYYRFVS